MKSLLTNPTNLKTQRMLSRMAGMVFLLFLCSIVLMAQANESQGTQPLQSKTVSSSFIDCKATDTGTNFVNERPQICSNPLFIHFENGETRTISTKDSFGFDLETGTPQNMKGFTVCSAGGNAYWLRNMGETSDALYWYVEWSGTWFPRKADNSLNTSLRKDFGPVKVCKASQQIAEGGGGGGGDPELPPGTPIFVDLNGDGQITLTNAANGILFDLNADGVKERIPVSPTDGLLVWDLDEDGDIKNGKYLFGNYTVRLTGNGYDVLKKFDEKGRVDRQGNHRGDGHISEVDGIYPGLKVWVDFNRNGDSRDPGELIPFSAIGRSLSTDYKESRGKDEHGNEMRFFSWYERLDGTKAKTVDVIFHK